MFLRAFILFCLKFFMLLPQIVGEVASEDTRGGVAQDYAPKGGAEIFLWLNGSVTSRVLVVHRVAAPL